MGNFGNYLIVIGIIIIFIGLSINFFSRFGFFTLPGDILIKRDNFTFYFPLTTSLLISAVLSIILFFLKR